jgi:phosphoribosylanthranilate isomerase
MKIKICGMTRPEDVIKCEESGTNLIGFINIERSQRFLHYRKIKNLFKSMKNKEKAVMVLEPENPEEVVFKMKKTGIKTLQLHSLSPYEIKYLKWIDRFRKNCSDRNLIVIRAVGLSEKSIDVGNYGEKFKFSSGKKEEIEGFAGVCDAIMFDYELGGKSGGTGRQIPIEMVFEGVKIAKNVNKNIKIFLAGGMNSKSMKNHKELFEKVFDYIDVNSGVEDSPGVKNHDKIEDFLIRAGIN